MITMEAFKDLAARALWTALQAFLAVLIMGGLSSAKAAGVAGLAAGVSVIKSYIGAHFGTAKTDVTFT